MFGTLAFKYVPVNKALELGAKKISEPEDQGFMFSWSFGDLDGHLWDLFWMDIK